MSVLTCQGQLTMSPNNTRNFTVSFVGQLEIGDLLTGTPTLAITSGGPTLSAAAVTTATKRIEMEDPAKDHWAKAGQAVTFTAQSSGTAAATYTVTVTCATTGGQSLQGFVSLVVASS